MRPITAHGQPKSPHVHHLVVRCCPVQNQEPASLPQSMRTLSAGYKTSAAQTIHLRVLVLCCCTSTQAAQQAVCQRALATLSTEDTEDLYFSGGQHVTELHAALVGYVVRTSILLTSILGSESLGCVGMLHVVSLRALCFCPRQPCCRLLCMQSQQTGHSSLPMSVLMR